MANTVSISVTMNTSPAMQAMKALQRQILSIGNKGQQSFGKINTQMQKAVVQSNKMRNSFLSADKILSGFGAYLSLQAVINQVREATQSFREFEKAMREVNTLLRETPAGFESLSSDVQALSVAFGFESSRNAEALYQIVSAGFTDTSEALDLLTQSNKLAVAGVSNTRDSFLLLNAALQPFNKDVSEAANVSDALFKTVERGLVTIPQLATNFNKVSQSSANIGVSMEETLAAISTITSRTSSSVEMTTTSIRALNNEILSKSNTAALISEKYGIALNGLFGENAVRDAGDYLTLIQQIDSELAKLDSVSRGSALAQLFGIESQKAFFSLTKEAEKFTEDLRAISDPVNATNKAFAEMEKSFSRSLEKAYALFDVLRQITISELIKAIQQSNIDWSESEQYVISITRKVVKIAVAMVPFVVQVANTANLIFQIFNILTSIGSLLVNVIVKAADNLGQTVGYIFGMITDPGNFKFYKDQITNLATETNNLISNEVDKTTADVIQAVHSISDSAENLMGDLFGDNNLGKQMIANINSVEKSFNDFEKTLAKVRETSSGVSGNLFGSSPNDALGGVLEAEFTVDREGIRARQQAAQQYYSFIANAENASLELRIDANNQLFAMQITKLEEYYRQGYLSEEQFQQQRFLLAEQNEDAINQMIINKRKNSGALAGSQVLSDAVDVNNDLGEFFRAETVEGIDSAYQGLRTTLKQTFVDAAKGAKDFQDIQDALFESLINNIINLMAQMAAAIVVAATLNVLTGGAFAGAGAVTSAGVGIVGGASGGASGGGGAKSTASLTKSLAAPRESLNTTYSSVVINSLDPRSVEEIFTANPGIITKSMQANISNSPGVRRQLGG